MEMALLLKPLIFFAVMFFIVTPLKIIIMHFIPEGKTRKLLLRNSWSNKARSDEHSL